MKKFFLLISVFGFFLFGITSNSNATLISSTLDLSGVLGWSEKIDDDNYNYYTEEDSEFSGSDNFYLEFSKTGEDTGRQFNSMMEFETSGFNHDLYIDFYVSQVNSDIFTYDRLIHSLGFSFGAYATLDFYSEINESVTFTKSYSGIGIFVLDHSIFYDNDGNSYSIWDIPFDDQLTFNHIAGSNYTYVFRVAFSLGGGNNEYQSDYSLNILTTPSDTAPIPEPGTMALLGIGLAGLGLYGYRRRSRA